MKKSELINMIREEFLTLVKEDRKAKEYVMSIEDEKEREEERKRMFGSDEGEIEEATYEVSPEDVDKIKNKVGDEDVVKVAEEEMDDDEMDKAAAKGAKGKDAKGVAAQATAALKAQTKKKALKAFMDKMKDAGVVSDANKVLDAGKYKEEFAKFKASL